MAQLSKILSPVSVASAGTRVRLTTSKLGASGIIFQANASNTGNIYIGDVTVTSSNGMALAPGDTLTISSQSLDGIMDSELLLNDFWLDADTAGNSVRVQYLTARP